MDWLRALLYVPEAASSVADRVDALHVFVITVTMVMATYVFGAAAWFAIRFHRRREGQLTEELRPSRFHEIAIISGVTGTFVLWWVLGYEQYVTMTSPPEGAQTVYLEAKQWMWKFTYDDGRSTNDVLVVPAGKPVKLVMSSRDVIHSFFVPQFRMKQDVVPGRFVTTWFEAKAPGEYAILCAEYCGVSHSRMRGEVVALSPEAYASWRRGDGSGPATTRADCGGGPGSCGDADLVTFGREVAAKRACVACHSFDGQRHVGPTWRGLFGAPRTLAGGKRVVADEAYLTRSMMEPLADVVDGYPPLMPSYQGQLSAAETGALVELIKSLRDAPESPGVALPRLEVRAVTDAGVVPSRGGPSP